MVPFVPDPTGVPGREPGPAPTQTVSQHNVRRWLERDAEVSAVSTIWATPSRVSLPQGSAILLRSSPRTS